MSFSTQIRYDWSPAAGSKTLRLMPDVCLRATPPHYLIYSSRGRGASFRTDDWQLALWIMSFAAPKAVDEILRELAQEQRRSVVSLLMHLYELGVLVETGPSAAVDSQTEHAATTEAVGALLQSVYDLAGELRGLGPAAHEMLRRQEGLSLQHRVETLLATVGALQAELAELRGLIVHRQVQLLGIDADSRDLRVHVGCGGHEIPGWINIDNHPAPLAISLQWGLPLPSGSTRYVFVSHLLEHLFYPQQAHRFLDEIRRVLQPGGIARVVVPDIEQCIRAYVDHDRSFFANRRKHWTWLPEDMTRLEGFLAYAGAGPNPSGLFEHHKFGYDFETLRRCLERVGLSNVRRCRYQGSPHEALRVDDASANASFKHGDVHYSLFVEAEASRA